MKYILIEKGEDAEKGDSVVIYETAEAREMGTCIAIFGQFQPDPQHEEEFKKCLETLYDRGRLEFEGDPGLIWIDAGSIVRCQREGFGIVPLHPESV